MLVGHRYDGKRFVVRADEKLTAFLELEGGDSPPVTVARLVSFVGCATTVGLSVDGKSVTQMRQVLARL